METVGIKLINSMKDLTLMIWKESMKYNLSMINLMMKSKIFMAQRNRRIKRRKKK